MYVYTFILFNYTVMAVPTYMYKCHVRQDADGRLLVTCVRALSDPNARGLIAANTGPPYLSLSSPLPSGIVMHFD